MDEQTEVEQQALQYAAENEDLIWTYLFSRTVRDICSEQKNGGPWGNEPPGQSGPRSEEDASVQRTVIFSLLHCGMSSSFLTKDIKRSLTSL